MTWIRGHKTYIVAGIMAVLSFAKAIEWIDEEHYLSIMGFLNAGGFAALRAGVKRVEEQAEVIERKV